MIGKVEELIGKVPPQSRLQKGLSLLMDYREGRLPELASIVANQKPGDKTQLAIEGDIFCALIQCFVQKTREQGRFEAHQCHTDLQFLCEGQEVIEVCGLHAQTNLPPFDAKGNTYFPLTTAPRTRLLLGPGDVAVLFPEDAHAPCLRVEADSAGLVRKIVIKVKDAHLPYVATLRTAASTQPC